MYERTFGTDWETLDDGDEALWRAFALGVAECLGADHPGELERITDAAGTTYDRSFIELAYQKGRQHVRQLESDDDGEIWAQLVEERSELDLWADPDSTAVTDAADDEAGAGLPDSLRGFRVDTLPADSTDRVQRPSFLEQENSRQRERSADRERTLFGSSRRKSTTADDSDGETDDSEGENESASESNGTSKSDDGAGNDH